ncbi:hypothetical protein I4U23_005427 [Adineta vaga]|nr:hypothetical protein I4U23_005427 [Adineta vaga]
MAQNSVTVWLDETCDSIVSNEINSDTHLTLCKIDPYLVTFRDLDKCADYIIQTETDEKKVLLLISSETPSKSLDVFLKLKEKFSHIDSVYCFTSNEFDSNKHINAPSGIYTNFESLCDNLRKLPDIQRHRRKTLFRDDFATSSISNTDPSSLVSSSIDDISTSSRQEAQFMYAQFLRDILITMDSSEEEMVEFCRKKCADNPMDLNVIDEFVTYYDSINAIFWYTRDTFLYRLLNKALREQDIDTLYSLRYFIKDLHLQLKQKHTTMTTIIKTEPLIETVYRGQLMNNEEFDKKIRYNTGGFFSVNSFLSTTSHKNLAMVYAGNRSKDKKSTEQSVLFQIDIDKTVNKFPYINISSQSAFDESEDEILFTMGVIFRIESVHLTDDNFWYVKLKLTGEEDDELRKLDEHMRKDIISTSPLGSLAKLMITMGQYDKAEKYHLMLLEDSTNIEDFQTLSIIYNNLGYIHYEMNREEKAIEYYENALEIKVKQLFENDSSLASTYNNLANVYRRQGKYDKALSYYHKAIIIDLNGTNPKLNQIANRYNNIGLVYREQQRYHEALDMFEQCLTIQLEVLPSNHPNIAISYGNISQIYYSLDDSEKTIEYLNRTFQIQINSLPPNHPDLSRTYNSFGQIYMKQNKLKEAIEMYDKSLKIELKTFPLTHPNILIIYHNISKVYNLLIHDCNEAIEYLNPILDIEPDSLLSNHLELAGIYYNLSNAYYRMGEFEQALIINEKSLKIRLKFLPTNHSDLAASYNNISQIYDSLGNHSKAIEYLDHTLQIQINSQSPNYSVLALTYNNLAGALYEQGEFEEALKLYKKSLQIRLEILPTNHSDIAISYNNIAQVYNSLDDYDESIHCMNQVLQIQINILPLNHIDLAKTYNMLGLSYCDQGQFEDALIMHNKALEIRLNNLMNNHSDIAASYYNISLVYSRLNDYEKSIEYLNKTLNIELNSLPANHPDLAKTYEALAATLYKQGNFQEALTNMKKCYAINSKYYKRNHPKIIDNIEKLFILTDKCEQSSNNNSISEIL